MRLKGCITRHFLLFKPSQRALKLARRSWIGPIHCYYPDNIKPNWKKPPFACTVIGQPLQIPAGQNIYHVAYTYANAILDEIDRLLPSFFHVGDWDFRFAFRFNLQFHLAYQGLPMLYSMLHDRTQARPSGLTLIDSHLTPDLVCEFSSTFGLGQPQCPIQCRSTLGSDRLMRKLRQWQEQALLAGTMDGVELAPETGGLLAVIPHQEHLALLAPVLDGLQGDEGVRVLALTAKIAIPAEGLRKIKGTLCQLSGLSQNRHFESALAHFESLRMQIGKLAQGQRQFCYTQIDLLSDLVEKFLAFEATMARLQPATVLGCLEFNLYGAFLSMMKQQVPQAFQLINAQHGIVGPSWTVDGLWFDDYFLWNRQTAESLRENGYPVTGRLHVMGNPKWETLAQQVASEPPSSEYENLMAWKGSAPLIGVYTQSLHGYSTGRIKKAYLLSLLNYLRHNPQCKLLIKRHPLETDDIVETVVKASVFADRVYVCEPEALPLWETLKAVDVVTSVFSATLCEGLYLQKPTLAIDFDQVMAIQQIPWPDDPAFIVTEPQALNVALDAALAMALTMSDASSSGQNAADVSRWDSIVPRFQFPHTQSTYAQRVQSWAESQKAKAQSAHEGTAVS
ncbi:hypothetical protein [Vampirovibrio chlorellavorus]|uniref:hypothetical protein n=1 Tax=Vampirovibrio chlorellavorus TaxID=758823 RepID=UPI0026F35127|nr:hypothetical protein [Vampirovibrio chlorellavorus]